MTSLSAGHVRPTGPEDSYAGIGMAVKYDAASFAPPDHKSVWPLVLLAIAALLIGLSTVTAVVVYILVNV